MIWFRNLTFVSCIDFSQNKQVIQVVMAQQYVCVVHVWQIDISYMLHIGKYANGTTAEPM